MGTQGLIKQCPNCGSKEFTQKNVVKKGKLVSLLACLRCGYEKVRR